MVYKQQKFNLLREETEGYSKLAVILCSLPTPSPIATTKTMMVSSQAAGDGNVTGTPATAAADVTRYIDQVLALIGHFDLDANR
jgi:THO complex subunit 2